MKTVNTPAELRALTPGTILISKDWAGSYGIYRRVTGPDATASVTALVNTGPHGEPNWGDPGYEAPDAGEYPLTVVHEPTGAHRSITAETFGQAAVLPDWTVLHDPTETLFWVVRPDWQLVEGTCRALVRLPAASTTLAAEPSMNWLNLTPGAHDPQEPLPDPLTVISLPATPGDVTVNWAQMWDYPPGGVFLDHSGDAWLRRDDERGRLLECVGTLHTYRPHDSPRTGVFRPIYLSGQGTAPATDATPRLIITPGLFTQDAAVQVGSLDELAELQAGLTLKDAAGYEFRTVMTDNGAAPENNDEITDGTEITFPAVVEPFTDIADLFELAPGTRLVDRDGGAWECGELGAHDACLIALPSPGKRGPMWVVTATDTRSRRHIPELYMPMRYAGVA